MKTFRILVSVHDVEEYKVEAKTAKEAEQLYHEDKATYISTEVIDSNVTDVYEG